MEIEKEVFTRISKLNIFLIPQYLWLLLLYYLMINLFYDFLINNLEEKNVIPLIPNEVLKLNEKIMTTIDSWLPFLFFIAISLFISGIIIGFIQVLPIIENYNFSYYGSIGVYLGLWIFLIASTYSIFEFSRTIFISIIPAIAAVKLLKDKI